MEDVLRTHVYLAEVAGWGAMSRVHGRYFGEIRPVNTLLQVGALVGHHPSEPTAEPRQGDDRQHGCVPDVAA